MQFAENNPHGTCRSCVWATVNVNADDDGDAFYVWKCWRLSGCPEERFRTTTATEPPACESHLRCSHPTR